MNPPIESHRESGWMRWPWWVLAPVTAHLAFSWIGFSPTDEGWLQAVARRIAEGEVPHRDFIFVRPALSALLQVPLVWWGGDSTLWLARLWGWLSLGAACWLWGGIVGARGATRLVLYPGALLLGAHTFPIMAWHTLDGLLLATLGVWCLQRERLPAAFLFVGCAALCRQNFALFAPVLAAAARLPWRGWLAAGLWSAAPAALYAGVIALLGGGAALGQQLAAVKHALGPAAVGAWVAETWFWAGLAGGGFAFWISRRRPALRPALPVVFAVLVVVQLQRGVGPHHQATFAATGAALALALARRDWLVGLAGTGLAWVTAISSGYNNPSLAGGVLLWVLWRETRDDAAPVPAGRRAPTLAIATSVLIAAAVAPARWRWPYCDKPAGELHWAAGDALPGARGLQTNVLTSATLAELELLTREAAGAGRTYALLSDFSAHWIRSRQRNPLPLEWALETEIGESRELRAEVVGALERLPAGSQVIVQKYFVANYAWMLTPMQDAIAAIGRYRIQEHVMKTWTKVGSGRFFDVYEFPRRD